MSRPGSWVTRHQVALSFGLTYAVSWARSAPYLLTRAELSEALVLVGVFGPALCCTIVSRMAEPEPGGVIAEVGGSRSRRVGGGRKVRGQ